MHPRRAAPARRRTEFDAVSKELRRALGDEEAEPEAVSVICAGAVKGCKNHRQFRGGNADAAIADLDMRLLQAAPAAGDKYAAPPRGE